jgi:hypothetical protein
MTELTYYVSKTKEELQLVYCDGKPLYLVTQAKNGTFKLYDCSGDKLVLLKTRKNNPLFKEVM